jgi:hypothetical protein
MTLTEFYPQYLKEHQNLTNRRLHFVASTAALGLGVLAIKRRSVKPLAAALVVSYGFAWTGHFFFEKNKPATFKYPLQSFACDWIMYRDMWRGQVALFEFQIEKPKRIN